MRPRRPIPNAKNELDATEISPVITYKLTEEERREIIKKYGLPKKDLKKDTEVKEVEEKKQSKKLTMDIIMDCLKKGMKEEEIAKEYGKDIKIVKMLVAKLDNRKLSKGNTSLKIISLQGLLEYRINHENKTLSVRSGQGNYTTIDIENIPRLIEELKDIQRIIS